LTALAEAALVPFRYVVEDASWTVTFWPAEVDTVKPDLDTLPTVPVVPPAAGPDRALDPPFPAWAMPNAAPAADPGCALDPTVAVCAVLAPAAPLPEVALTIPRAPPPITTAAAAAARGLLNLRLNICDLLRVDVAELKLLGGAGALP
jgi:hypothetical protein